MRIERIELIGFKSFSEKTAFNFHPGTTAVVGPNGCGKSNIVDAFKWVLGEQSAKSLRGDSMEDVIFSGCASKKPKGMAEVTLYISGISNGSSPDSGEISVTRRLYRSGESAYLMNKVPCRLKDIRNVFLDTGLELKTYSVLEQGRIDAILNSKPHERRFLIEEVAGVMKYNVRREEAVRKLEASLSNLQRLADIVAEVKRQINSIDRHAKRAERYKRLFDEAKNIELKVAVRDAAELDNELANFTSSEETLKSKETELSTDIHSSEAALEEKKLVFIEEEKVLDELHNRLSRAERNFVEEKGRITLLKSNCENLTGRLERLVARDNELTAAKEDTGARIQVLETRSQGINTELSETGKVLDSRNEIFSSFENEIVDSEQNLEVKRKDVFNKADEISSLKNEISSLSLIIENLNRKEEKNFAEINVLKESVSSIDASIKQAEDEFGVRDRKLEDSNKTKQGLIEDIDGKKRALTSKAEVLYKDREDLAAISSRAESLKELDTGGKKAFRDNIKVLCRVADIFETLPEHETAIEAVLGDKLSAAVVDDDQEIKKALDLIKKEKINRSGFIPANISPASRPLSSVPLPGGVVGYALDLVKVREGFDRIAAALLSDVIIVNDLDTAFDLRHASLQALSKESGPRYFVTLDGEVLEPSGVVFGGQEKGVLKIKREIREIQKDIEARRSHVLSAEKEVSAIKSDIASAESSLAAIDSEISEVEKVYHELRLKIAGLHEENGKEQRRLGLLSAEVQEERKEKDSSIHALDAKNRDCAVLEDQRRSIEDEIKDVQDRITEKKFRLETLRAELTKAMLSRTAIRGQLDALSRERERLDSDLTAIEKKKEEMSKERVDIETDRARKENEIKGKEGALGSSVAVISQLKEELSSAREKIESKTAELRLMEKRQKAFVDDLTSVRKELSHAEVKKTELSLRLGHIKEDLKRTYAVDMDSDTDELSRLGPLLPEEEEKLNALREKLQGMGTVNLGTLEELEELKTRHDFLTKQQNDLIESITSLQETISKINRTTQKKLADAFEALNEKFKEVFTVLFGKGRAELILTEGSILEAGIEIVAQPPGKKLQNLMLLSGGEKALTALSLLFAGFMIKPTPLCLLDEVDAPLDESNTERFAALLKELVKEIQFIVITHNRRTMEAADYLYGVTMEEPGVSKVVSMHLAEVV
ncbi:MAG TPA: chromosome segregation protein SMC [Nitrospirae bacterium]|nr:chromosome segregation protein SMC [Nitrospirota bacterium]